MPAITMSDLRAGKSVAVCAIVVGCFAVLWPKIFHPMLFGRPPPVADIASDHPLNDHMRLQQGQRPPFPTADPAAMQRTIDKEFKPGPVPGMMRPSMGGIGISPQIPQRQQSQGAMGFLLPLYTIGIVIFFVYTTLRLMLKKTEEPQTSNIPDMYRSYQSYVNRTDQQDSDIHEVQHELVTSASVVHTDAAEVCGHPRDQDGLLDVSFSRVLSDEACKIEKGSCKSSYQSNIKSAGSQASMSKSQSNKPFKDDASQAQPETQADHRKATDHTIDKNLKKATVTCEENVDAREAEISQLKERLEATEKAMASIISLMKANNVNLPSLEEQ